MEKPRTDEGDQGERNIETSPTLSRRGFLKQTVVAGAVAATGLSADEAEAARYREATEDEKRIYNRIRAGGKASGYRIEEGDIFKGYNVSTQPIFLITPEGDRVRVDTKILH